MDLHPAHIFTIPLVRMSEALRSTLFDKNFLRKSYETIRSADGWSTYETNYWEVMPVNPEKSKKTSIVLPLEVYEKIEKLSTNESRTISQMIGVLLKEALEKREQPK